MKILLTGATGYVGKRLLPVLVQNDHQVVCCVRDKSRFNPLLPDKKNITVLENDFTDLESLKSIPSDIDAAYYLIHSMADSSSYDEMELNSAENFRKALSGTNVKHVLYLSGIVNDSSLSKHLQSRKRVETVLAKGNYNFTCIRAGIIVGSGSASFEIIRDLVEKLPVMIAPRWLMTRCQPVAVSDVINVLSKSLMNEKTFNQSFDIGSEKITTYEDMLLDFAKIRNLKRFIWIVPVMTPRLSSYWLYFVTSTSFRLASALVDSMKIEVICRNNDLINMLGIKPLSYSDAIRKAFDTIENNEIISSWKDSYSSSGSTASISKYIQVPEYGCFIDKRIKKMRERESCLKKIWSIGGDNGWYYANWLWEIRGFLDKVAGGVGLRRGRTNRQKIAAGDALDFWRVIYADKSEGRLLLFAEMKLPGEAWLEFKIVGNDLVQTATFRPRGLSGRLYWYLVYPFHGFIFNGLIKKLTE